VGLSAALVVELAEDVGLGIHHSEGAHVIGEVQLEVGGECSVSLVD
jgi:hypothetical protein